MSNPTPVGPLLPRRVVFRSGPSVCSVRPVLALTLYLEDAEAWAARWAAELFARFLDEPGLPRLQRFRTSTRDEWRSMPSDPRTLIEPLRSHRVRHLFRFRAVDRVDAPSAAFAYREVDSARTGRTGYVQLVLPFDRPHDSLLALAVEVSQLYRVSCAIGGYSLVGHEDLPRNAFHSMYRLCKRFWGLDVQLPERASKFARAQLPSLAWLSILGDAFLERRGTTRVELTERIAAGSKAAIVMETAAGLLIRSGRAPELGDTNLMEHPFELASLCRALAPYCLQGGFHFPADWSEPEGADESPLQLTDDWRNRFMLMEGW